MQSLNDPIDTTTPQVRLTFNLFASLAEFEKDIIRERRNAGLEAARSRGRFGGKPKGLSNEAQVITCVAETLYNAKELSFAQIIKNLAISKSTLYSYLRHRNFSIGKNKLSYLLFFFPNNRDLAYLIWFEAQFQALYPLKIVL